MENDKANVLYALAMLPHENEEICPISYEITEIRLGGGPDTRPSFWKVYREELELNRKTEYRNEHIRICRNVMKSLRAPQKGPLYFRNNHLVSVRDVEPGPKPLH